MKTIPAKPYIVSTRDVDGSTVHTYKTYTGASKRFAEMSGYPLQLGQREYTLVSDYGCVVTFYAEPTAIVPPAPAPAPAQSSSYDDDDDAVYEDGYIEPVQSSSPYATYGGAEHQAYGDRWLYADCQGAW